MLIVSFILLIGLSAIVFGNNVKAIFNPISIVGTIANAELKETDGRTNILVLGSDKRNEGPVTSVLTDTILVASIGRVEKDVVLISLPRDLWVQTPKNYFTKINAVYSGGGGEDMKTTVSEVLGIPIHYYAVVDFVIFKETVDIFGGIDVNVENSFTDYNYPIEGKENAPFDQRYETISFEEGTQTMDGETALKFARSRKGDNNEGTDFARSARQQKVIMAIKDKALALETIINPIKLKELYDTYQDNVDTDIVFADIQNFYLLSQQIEFDAVKSIVLDDRSAADEGGLLYAPEDRSLYGGAYILLPKVGDFSQLHAYVQRYIFGN
jgi:LCP family protein required for cell wall assembly